jgi:hypothetical protein
MAYPIPSTFTRYQLTPEEIQNGSRLTIDNLYMMQNLICDAAEEKLALKYDPQNPMAFTQREAELQGQIGILKLLVELAVSSSSTITIQE